jgi:multidrug efflux pump subunit AcrB
MVRYFIQRPIAILMTFSALVVAGLVMIGKLPVSLLPNIDVPQILIRVNYPNTPAPVIEENILRPIRENLINVSHLKNIQGIATNHTGLLYLNFEYGSKMDLSYIEVNEKMDRLSNSFPRDMERPQVIRINTSDIPVIRVQVIPKTGIDYLEVSAFSEKVLKKRLEQIEGVSLVDINGTQKGIIAITPDEEMLKSLNLDKSVLIQTIQNANRDLGGLNVKDGHYRYFVKVSNTLENVNDIANLPVQTPAGEVIPLRRIAKISQELEKQTGYHLYNGEKGIVITVQKQPGSQMNTLLSKIKEAIKQFKIDYPNIEFAVTQDQTFLLDAGIDNLYQDLFYGGILTIALLFMFLGNWVAPTLMGINIPLSLIITFVFFYVFNISFNIISLSGLALGIGMMIDNSIVVIDNITRKRRQGMSMIDSSVYGTNEVITPVISQVITTVAVYAPLTILGDMAGALVYDQSIALTISLAVSLLVAFILTPLLYTLLLKQPPEKLQEDTAFYKWVAKGYHGMIHHILKHKLIYLGITLFVMPLGFWFASKIPISSLPKIEKLESMVLIDWNDPIDAKENLRRVKALQSAIQPGCKTTEAEVGIKQFLLQQDNSAIQKAELYFLCASESAKLTTDDKTRAWLSKSYPHATFKIINAPNAFTQLFVTSSPYFEARFKSKNNAGSVENYQKLQKLLKSSINLQYQYGPGLITEPNVSLTLDYEKMAVYGVEKASIENLLQQLFGTFAITEIKRFGEVKNIRLKTDRESIDQKLNSSITGKNNTFYSLKEFITTYYDRQPKFITSDKTGEYWSIVFDENIPDFTKLQNKLSKLSAENGFAVDFAGQYFENKNQLNNLWYLFLIVLVLLYFILAVQYENLILPLIVMLTIPLGITGGMFLLWLTRGTLDVMAAIGFIVILGLIVDDPILKVETLNRIEKQYRQKGLYNDPVLLEKMIHEAGSICLKPLLMVSLTTSIAMIPVLFIGGIGNNLQKSLAIVIIGGLTIGTFFTTWFIPLAYWYVKKWGKNMRTTVAELNQK